MYLRTKADGKLYPIYNFIVLQLNGRSVRNIAINHLSRANQDHD